MITTNNRFHIGDKVWVVDSNNKICQVIIKNIQFTHHDTSSAQDPEAVSLDVFLYGTYGSGLYAPNEVHLTVEDAVKYLTKIS